MCIFAQFPQVTVQRNWRITKASCRHCYCSVCISSSRMSTGAPSGLAPCHPGGSALSQCGCTQALGVQSPPRAAEIPHHTSFFP